MQKVSSALPPNTCPDDTYRSFGDIFRTTPPPDLDCIFEQIVFAQWK